MQGTLGQILQELSQREGQLPRHQPGEMILEGRAFRYAELHSFYYQAKQIFADNIYAFQPDTPKPRILDCGAHIGLASLFFKSQFPQATITAFEADPRIADFARFNMNSFGLADVDIQTAAVWTHDRGINFMASNDDAGHVDDQGTDNVVPSVRLRDLIQNEKIDLLKLDVEGAEFDILEDCEDVLHNVSRLVVEIHMFRDHHSSLGRILSIIEAADFKYVPGDFHLAEWLPSRFTPPFPAIKGDRYYLTVFAWR